MQSARRTLILVALLVLANLAASPSAHAQVPYLVSATLIRDQTTGIIAANLVLKGCVYSTFGGPHPAAITSSTLAATSSSYVNQWLMPSPDSNLTPVHVTLTYPGSAGTSGTQAVLTVSGYRQMPWDHGWWLHIRWTSSITVTLP